MFTSYLPRQYFSQKALRLNAILVVEIVVEETSREMSRDKRLQRVANGSQKEEEEGDNLLVFGYQCKIFRDDERARFIDQGLHLIPWMNDSTLTIDRSVAR